MPVKRKRQWTEDEKELARQAHAAKCKQARIDAGGLDVEIEQVRHERLVHNDEELRAFRADHKAALKSHNGDLRVTGFNDIENLAFNLIGACLGKNLTGFASMVQDEMRRRTPGAADAEIQAAYRRAHEEWVDAYSN